MAEASFYICSSQHEDKSTESRPNKWYSTKANLFSYLRSYSCSGKLIDAVYQSAGTKEEYPPFPATLADCDAQSATMCQCTRCF